MVRKSVFLCRSFILHISIGINVQYAVVVFLCFLFIVPQFTKNTEDFRCHFILFRIVIEEGLPVPTSDTPHFWGCMKS